MSESRDKIRALSTREQCREKLPTWFGSRENYLHGFREIIGNSVDEINNNYSKGIITVTLQDDMRTLSVSDTGRGIPIFGETDGTPNYELLFETLFAGTNYDNNNNGKETVGTNGVGTCVLNHTSSLFEVKSIREGKVYAISYYHGNLERSELVVGKASSDKVHGTIVTFRLDDEVYTNTVYNPEDLKGIIKRIAGVANKITFKFRHKGEESLYKYDNMEDYFQDIAINMTSKAVNGPQTQYIKENESNKIQILFGSTSDPIHESFLNNNYLPEKGSIHTGIVQAIRLFINNYCKDQKLIDKKATISATDIEDSITYVCSVLSTNVEFANQTKLSTSKKLYESVAREYIKGLLEAYQAEQPKEFDKFVKHILQVNKFNNKNSAAKQKLKKQLEEKVDTITSPIEKLVDCEEHGPESEIYIAEGDSAKGSLKAARNSAFQAILPLRGKILNCLKADDSQIFSNQIIMNLVRAMGCGIITEKKNKDIENFNIKNCTYGKYIIATDADADGEQIACLIITMIYRLQRPLIEAGMVYIAQTPLYEVKLEDDTMVYIFNEAEKESKLAAIKGKYTIARCKGLGEVDPHILAETAMDPETRNLIQVTTTSAEAMIQAVETFMGEDVTGRKEYVEENLYKYIDVAD